MKRTICILFAALAFATCKKEGPPGPQGPAGPQGPSGAASSPGSFAGKVRLFDSFGDSISSTIDPVTVRVAGKSHSTTVATGGHYTLSGVPAGIHTLIFESNNFGTMQFQEVAHPGNDRMTANQSLYLKPSFNLSNVTAQYSSSSYQLNVQGSVPFSTKPLSVVAIVGQNHALDIDNPATYNKIIMGYIPSFTSGFNLVDYLQLPPKSYMKVYPYNAAGYMASYYDLATEQSVCTAHGTAYPVTFTLVP